MIGAELELLLRRLIREELAAALGHPSATLREGPEVDDDAELRELAIARAAKLRRAQRDEVACTAQERTERRRARRSP